MVDMLFLVWGTALCAERVKPPKSPLPPPMGNMDYCEVSGPQVSSCWRGAMWLQSPGWWRELGGGAENTGLPPTIPLAVQHVSNTNTNEKPSKVPLVNIILTDTELRGRVLERCLFSDVKKVRGAFVDIFGYPVLLITFNGTCPWEKYTRKWELQRFNLNYQGDAGMSW